MPGASGWLAGFGVAVITIGMLLLTPMSKVLPVELWLFLKHPFDSSHAYFRLAKAAESKIPELALAAGVFVTLGVVLIAIAQILESRSSQ